MYYGWNVPKPKHVILWNIFCELFVQESLENCPKQPNLSDYDDDEEQDDDANVDHDDDNDDDDIVLGHM